MTNQVAIITGASRGIGAATAELLASKGYAVCVNYFKNAELAQQTVKKIEQQGGKAIAVQADMQSEQDIIRLFEIVEQQLGNVTALVNNAGISEEFGLVENITLKKLEKTFSTNVYATFLCCREAIQRMKKNRYGNIVNVSSEAAKFGGNQLAHYAASKAAINTLTLALAREVANYQIRVNAVSPGVIATDAQTNLSEERLQNLQKSLPMGRMGNPEEVAQTIAWLLSEQASYVSGSILTVSGAR